VIHRPLQVLVATPAGGTGQGGIDRMMASLKAELAQRPDIRARFAATRGNGVWGLVGIHLLRFCASMAVARIRGRIDLVHINLASNGSTYRKLIVAGWARMLGIPYVIHLHGAEYRSFWSASDTWLNHRIHGLFERASRIVVLGSPWKAFVAGRVPDARGRIIIVPNAVAQPRLAHTGGGHSVHILFLGRIEERKGVPHLVRALSRMREMEGWHATIAGDGAVENLREQISDLGLSARVAVPGWLGPDETAQLMAAGDILTLPSLSENLPMSIIEAMASGLAVVATPVGAVEDIVTDGETGLLVPPANDGALSEALAKLVQDKDLRQRLGAAAQRFQMAHLAIGPYADTISAIWKEAAAAKSSRPAFALAAHPRKAKGEADG
jgi:glycosyltransferase involved in cell wall biosynthesis